MTTEAVFVLIVFALIIIAVMVFFFMYKAPEKENKEFSPKTLIGIYITCYGYWVKFLKENNYIEQQWKFTQDLNQAACVCKAQISLLSAFSVHINFGSSDNQLRTEFLSRVFSVEKNPMIVDYVTRYGMQIDAAYMREFKNCVINNDGAHTINFGRVIYAFLIKGQHEYSIFSFDAVDAMDTFNLTSAFIELQKQIQDDIKEAILRLS